MITCTPPHGCHTKPLLLTLHTQLNNKFIQPSTVVPIPAWFKLLRESTGFTLVLWRRMVRAPSLGRAAQDQDCQAVTRPRVSDLWYPVRTNLTSVDLTLQQLSTLGPPDLQPVPALDHQRELQEGVQSEENQTSNLSTSINYQLVNSNSDKI